MTDDKPTYTKADLAKTGQKWMARIHSSGDRLNAWLKDAEGAESAYLAGRTYDDGKTVVSDQAPEFNILHSNVETIVPSIYNSTPVPDIRPRHGNSDPSAKMVAEVIDRAIRMQIDDSRLDEEIEALAQDAFIAGRGIARVRLEADVGADGSVTGETVVYENVSWRDYREGPARAWRGVPWVAYRHYLEQADLESLSDEDMVALQAEAGDDTGELTADVPIWEIWCKKDRKVYFIADQSCKVLKIADDPLGLKGFFPQVAPVQPVTATSNRMPVCPYSIYKVLAEELDTATTRINAVMSGLRLRGLIAGDASVMDVLNELDDNEIGTVPDLENLVAAGGLDKAVMWWPVEQAIKVLQQLYTQRDQTKAAIYEITGISDIIRGQGAASETATAQQIKTEWGALRIKKMQRMVERQVRGLFVLTAEIICGKFTPETLARITGLQIPQEAMALLQQPLDHYAIDIESDSTVRGDTMRGRQEMTEFLSGTAQYFSTMAPLVQSDPGAAVPVAEIYGAFARNFNLGKTTEDALEQLTELAKQAASQPKANPEAEAMQAQQAADQQKAQMEGQKMQADNEMKQQEMQIDVEHKRALLDLEREKLAMQKEQYAAENRVRDAEAMGKLTDGSNVIETAIEAVVARVVGEIQANDARLMEIMAMLAQSNAAIVAAMSAPKELIRDEAGRPVGVRPMTDMRLN